MSNNQSQDIELGNVVELTKSWSDDMKLSLAKSWGWNCDACEGGKDGKAPQSKWRGFFVISMSYTLTE